MGCVCVEGGWYCFSVVLLVSFFNANARGKFLQPLPTPERRFIAIERFGT